MMSKVASQNADALGGALVFFRRRYAPYQEGSIP